MSKWKTLSNNSITQYLIEHTFWETAVLQTTKVINLKQITMIHNWCVWSSNSRKFYLMNEMVLEKKGVYARLTSQEAAGALK